MLKIYHVPKSRSMRIVWLCEELALPYEVERIDFSPEFRFSPAWLAFNPVGKVPAMEIDGFTMFESGAMVETILERHGGGRLRPRAGTEASARYLQWSWFAEATFARPLGDIVQHTWIKPESARIPAVVDDAGRRVHHCLRALEEALESREHLLGAEFTAADVMMGYCLLLARRLEIATGPYPNVERYHATLERRPAYRRALE